MKRANKRAVNIICLVRSGMMLCNKSVERLAADTGISAATIYRRFKQPDTMTIKEFVSICKTLGVPIDKAREALRY